MIKRKTVLVLGAGASKPYGLPTGLELRGLIRAMRDIQADDMRTPIFEACGVRWADVGTIAQNFRDSGVMSIDAYLEKHAELVEAGKVMMARELCRLENPKEVVGQANDHWYEYLWHHMHPGLTDPHEVSRNQIRILTFNYDRSLEFFLYTAIKSTFRISDEAALAAMQRLPIEHVYGQVGPFHFADSATARAYRRELSTEGLRLAADGLKIVPDARRDDPVFKSARDWFRWADDICFLGFGFDPTNCERLGLKDIVQERRARLESAPRIFASVHGLTPAEVETARTRTTDADWGPRDFHNLMALRHTDLFQWTQ